MLLFALCTGSPKPVENPGNELQTDRRIASFERQPGALNRFLEPRESNRLAKKIEGPGIKGCKRKLRSVRNQTNKRNLGPALVAQPSYRAHDIKAVRPRHFDVEKQEIGAEPANRFEHLLGGVGHSYQLNPLDPTEEAQEPIERQSIVFDDQDSKRSILGFAKGFDLAPRSQGPRFSPSPG